MSHENELLRGSQQRRSTLAHDRSLGFRFVYDRRAAAVATSGTAPQARRRFITRPSHETAIG
jgi:hypothetical protein